MAAGDTFRVWFPEMVDALVAAWTPAMTWEALGGLCLDLADERKRIRSDRGIVAARFRCRCCGEVTTHDITRITIRSALFALRDRGAVTQAELDDLDRAWKRYRARNGLDACARPRSVGGDQAAGRGHEGR
jgi:hypothetical protein